MTNIFIANLDFGITSEDLRATFSQFGNVSYAHVVYEPETKRSKGFGYIEMDDTDQAIAAIQALNGLEVNGRSLDVKIASPKGNRPPKKEAPAPKKEYTPPKNELRTKQSESYANEKPEKKPERVMRPRRKMND